MICNDFKSFHRYQRMQNIVGENFATRTILSKSFARCDGHCFNKDSYRQTSFKCEPIYSTFIAPKSVQPCCIQSLVCKPVLNSQPNESTCWITIRRITPLRIAILAREAYRLRRYNCEVRHETNINNIHDEKDRITSLTEYKTEKTLKKYASKDGFDKMSSKNIENSNIFYSRCVECVDKLANDQTILPKRKSTLPNNNIKYPVPLKCQIKYGHLSDFEKKSSSQFHESNEFNRNKVLSTVESSPKASSNETFVLPSQTINSIQSSNKRGVGLLIHNARSTLDFGSLMEEPKI